METRRLVFSRVTFVCALACANVDYVVQVCAVHGLYGL